MRVALALGLVSVLGCEEAPRFGSPTVVQAPHPAWSPGARTPGSGGDESFRTHAPQTAQAEAPPLPVVEETRFSNGVRVLTVERHGLPVASVGLVVGRGALAAPPSVASLAAEMLFADTSMHEGLALRQLLAEMGAHWDRSASHDGVSIDATLPATNVNAALPVLVEVLRASTFPADQIDLARSRVDVRIAHQASDPTSAAAQELDAWLYPAGHRYRVSVDGDAGSLRRAGSQDLLEFWHRCAIPALTTVIVAGDLDRAAVVTRLHGLLDDWAGAPVDTAPLPRIDATPNARVVLLDHSGDSQAVVRLGWLVPDRGDPDIPMLRTLATALGHDATGRLGVLHRSLRIERGETYGVQSFVWPRPGASEFVVTTSIERDRLVDALRELFSAIERVRSRPLDEHELPAARSLSDMLTWRSLETSHDLVNALTTVAVYNEPLGAFYDRLRALSVSAETLRTVAKRYLVPESRVIVVVGDARYVRPALAEVGLTGVPVRPLDTAAR